MKLLVVGAAGQVGQSVVRRASAHGDTVVAAYKSRTPVAGGANVEQLDKSDRERCREVVGRLRPDVVVDTGALHNVDYCESHPDEAFGVNRDGTRNLAQAAEQVGARFVFVSTDFVFDGHKQGPYQEADVPSPESTYARSKLEGEVAAARSNRLAAVVRPSVIYSWLDSRNRQASSSGKGINFGTWLVEEVARGRPVRVVQDQIASPTLADDLAEALLDVTRAGRTGTFHAAGATACSRYDFSVALVRRLGLDAQLVTPVATADLHQVARRPLNSSLSSERLAAETGHRMLELSSALDRFAHDFESDPGAPGRG
jgi:dTDP-4-dehydrorhamnose reductase